MRSSKRTKLAHVDNMTAILPGHLPLASEPSSPTSALPVGPLLSSDFPPSPSALDFPSTVGLPNGEQVCLLDRSPFGACPKGRPFPKPVVEVLQAVWDQARPRGGLISKQHVACVALYCNITPEGARNWFNRAHKRDEDAERQQEDADELAVQPATEDEADDGLADVEEDDSEESLVRRFKQRKKADKVRTRAVRMAQQEEEQVHLLAQAIRGLRRATFEQLGKGWVIPDLEIAFSEEWVYPEGIFLGGDIRTLKPLVVGPIAQGDGLDLPPPETVLDLDLDCLFYDNTIPIELLLDYPPDPTFAPADIFVPGEPGVTACNLPLSPDALPRQLFSKAAYIAVARHSAYLDSTSDTSLSSLTSLTTAQSSPAARPVGSATAHLDPQVASDIGSQATQNDAPYPRTKPKLMIASKSGPPDFLAPDAAIDSNAPFGTGSVEPKAVDVAEFDPILQNGPGLSAVNSGRSPMVSPNKTDDAATFLANVESLLLPAPKNKQSTSATKATRLPPRRSSRPRSSCRKPPVAVAGPSSSSYNLRTASSRSSSTARSRTPSVGVAVTESKDTGTVRRATSSAQEEDWQEMEWEW